MPQPPAPHPDRPGQPPSPWAPRGPGDRGPATTSTWAPAGPGLGAGGPSTATWAPTPRPGGPVAPTAPWAPPGWQGGPASAPLAAGVGGGAPPHPPGYQPPEDGGGASPAAPSPPSSSERGGRLLSALVGGIVGAVVAALVASGLVLATTDDDPEATGPTATTSASGGGGMGIGDSLDLQQILEIAQPTVVSINTESGVQPGATGAGSGFVYDADEGLILTNAHVIEGASEISVTFFDGTAMGAELVGAFVDDDVAMLRVPETEGLVAATLGSSDELKVGEDVVAIGNALGLGGQPTVTTGIVSAKDRSITGDGISLTNLIQTDAAINPGNSGGPLLNSRGEVVGINTAKIPDASNIGFALAIDNLRPLIEELRSGNGEINEDQAFLGTTTVALADAAIPPAVLDQYGITDDDGLFVQQVSPGSAAEEAGIEEGDVILEADGQTTDTNEALGEVIRSHEPGDTITIVLERRGERMEVTATLKRRGG